MLDVEYRMIGAIEEIRERHGDASVVVISQCDPIRALIAHFCGIVLDCLERVAIDPGSISILEIGDNGTRLVALSERNAEFTVPAD